MPIDDFEVRGMLDLVIIDHFNKTIYPIDLKTSSTPEWEFFRSFIKWRYDIQARLYWQILKYNIDQHSEFKDYEVADFTFIVINKETLTPLSWVFHDTKAAGTLRYGKLDLDKLYNRIFNDCCSIDYSCRISLYITHGNLLYKSEMKALFNSIRENENDINMVIICTEDYPKKYHNRNYHKYN
jgi:hypothetical protein